MDDSSLVLARNTPHDRKTLVQASALDLTTPLADRRFDLVIVNNLLHHLVGPSRQLTRENVVRCLGEMRQLLSTDGRILIYETTYEGWWPGIDPGDLIYLLPSIRAPLLAKPLRRLGANTAGIGVGFRSRAGWRSVFGDASLQIEAERVGFVGTTAWLRFVALGIRRMGAHFFLLRAS